MSEKISLDSSDYNYEKINEIHCTIRFDFRRMYKC